RRARSAHRPPPRQGVARRPHFGNHADRPVGALISVPGPLYLVFANVREGASDDEFNRWYSDNHVPHALALDGWEAGTRYRAWPRRAEADVGSQNRPSHQYLCVYEWAEGDPRQRLDALH